MPDLDTLQSFKREAWVIPNRHGQLWTDRIFSTEADALAYLKANWTWDNAAPRPARANVQVTATLLTALIAEGGRADERA